MPSVNNTNRIAKNTLMLYFRQILIMLVSLYTVRVVLNVLGAEDYGIYNVVAGVVTMFTFLTNSMATASQRYFSFDLGMKDFDSLKKTFNLTLIIYFFVGCFILIIAETIGLWFVKNKLVLPENRLDVAIWIYHFSIISFFLTIMTAPFLADIVAHEDMSIYAYVSIVEAFLKLLSVYLLQICSIDKLWLYSLLLLIIAFINTTIYRIICRIKYEECKYYFYWNFAEIKAMTSYVGWNLIGNTAAVFKNQLVSILLNQFFNPVVNAARGLALNVNNVLISFSANFSTALNPQIVKQYAANEKEEMYALVYKGCKLTYFLMWILSLPFIVEVQFVLNLWLKNIPEYTISFTRLVLVDSLITSLSYPLMSAAQASGRIKIYQIVVGGIQLLNLPISYLVLRFGAIPESVMIVSVIISLIALLLRIIIVNNLVGLSVAEYIMNTIVPIIFVSVFSMMAAIFIHKIFSKIYFGELFSIIVIVFSTILFIILFGLTKQDRSELIGIIKRRKMFR